VAALVAVAIVLALTPVVRRAALALNIVDRPGPLKVQREPVPYLGGVALFVAIGAVLSVTHPAWLWPLALAMMLGIVDDVRAISPRWRFVAQTGVGLVAGVVAPAPGPAGVVVTAALVLVLVNAVNLIDGMDGLASCVVLVSALGFAILGGDARVLAFAVVGAVVGFLVFNRPPARIYLGDGGAYLLGTAIAVMAACAPERHAGVWFELPLLVGLPVADAGIAIVRRVRAGRSFMAGDRSHVYDQLADRGWSIPRVVVACAGAQAVATVLGVAVGHVALAPAAAIVACAAMFAFGAAWKAGLITAEVVT